MKKNRELYTLGQQVEMLNAEIQAEYERSKYERITKEAYESRNAMKRPEPDPNHPAQQQMRRMQEEYDRRQAEFLATHDKVNRLVLNIYRNNTKERLEIETELESIDEVQDKIAKMSSSKTYLPHRLLGLGNGIVNIDNIDAITWYTVEKYIKKEEKNV